MSRGSHDASGIFRAPLPPPSSLSATNLIQSIRASKFSPELTTSNQPNNTNGSQSSKTSRVSKFSDHPVGVSLPPPGIVTTQASKIDAVAAAAAAAAKINASLRAKGKLSDQTLLKPVGNSNSPLSLIKISETKKVFNSWIAKIDINDLPLSSRTYFTQVSIQETINKETGVAISTKGQYLTPEERKHLDGIEKQLHLFIQSPSQEKTDTAVAKIKEMISKQKLPTPPLNVPSPITPTSAPPIKPVPPGQPSLPTGNFVQEKVFIGMDYCVPEFDLKSKLIGANYANFNFVANATGAKVILRGRGSGFIEPTSGREAFESMYVFISHPNQSGVNAAKKLVYNLIATVNSEYSTYMAKKAGAPPPANFPALGNYPQYPPNPPVPAIPYGNMPVPQNITYSHTYPPPPPQPPAINPYSTPPPPIPINPYNIPPPTGKPYNLPNPPTSFSMPPPSTNFKTPTLTQSTSTTASVTSSTDIKPPSANSFESKSRRRRFQEEQPDDSNVLGYTQYSQNHGDNNKRPRKDIEKTFEKELPTTTYKEKNTSNLPFWMSHD